MWLVFCTQEAELSDEIQRIEREKELLSHSVADRNAELQLQISRTSVSHVPCWLLP